MPDKRPTIAQFKRKAARRLRTNSTAAESQLWRRLRHMPMHGSHFRRQVPIGPYIADFACMAARLIVEIDGSQHAGEIGMARDESRTKWFEARGYRVVRFWNNEVGTDIDGVLAAIYVAVYGSSDAEPRRLKHQRLRGSANPAHPTPARSARRPSPSRGG